MDEDRRQPGPSTGDWWADRPAAVDALVAVVVAAVELVNLYREVVVAGYDPPLPVAAVAAWLLAMSVVLVWRRRRPVAVLVAVALAAGAYAVIDLPTLNLPLLVVIFTAGLVLDATAAVGVALVLGAGAVNLVRGTVSQLPIDLVVFGAVWLLGRHQRVRQEHARDVERRRAAELWRARSQERTRLARDLHDIVSNGVGGIYLEAVGAAGLVERDPSRARAALDAIQGSARATLDELRTLLAVLRLDPDDPEAAGRSAPPSLADLDALVARARATGASIDVEVAGRLDTLPAGTSATAYRTVQEALGNAVRHGAGAPILLRVRAGEGLQIEVSNALAADATPATDEGWGLTGMRERISALGGTLDISTRDGHFDLTAVLPTSAVRG